MVNEIGSIPSVAVTAPRSGQVPANASGSVSASASNASGRVLVMPSASTASVSVYSQVVAGRAARVEGMAEAAVQVRKADGAMAKADALLDQIQENLTRIVKQYPPYGQDSPERLRYLNAVSGLRKQLDALAFPPERKTDEVVPVQIYPVKAELSVPELDPETASDESVKSALDTVSQARESLSAHREQMWRDVAGFVGKEADGRQEVQAEQDLSAVQRYVASNPGEALGLGRRESAATGL